MQNPVLVVAFNRPQRTRALIESIQRLYAPTQLYLAVDGPRIGRALDCEKVRAVRQIALEFANTMRFETLFQEENLGCAVAVPTAISWFFAHEGQGIILEDDIEVTAGFFRYMDWCLDHFKDDERILHVSSYHPVRSPAMERQPEIMITTHPNVWGWGTWRRAWRLFDAKSVYASRREIMGWAGALATDRRAQFAYWLAARLTAQGKLSSWAYPWLLSIARAGGRCVTPRTCLVRNSGLGADSTHTARAKHLDTTNLGDVDWNSANLVGRVAPEVGEEIHLTTNRAQSWWKLARSWCLTLLPNRLFFLLQKRFR